MNKRARQRSDQGPLLNAWRSPPYPAVSACALCFLLRAPCSLLRAPCSVLRAPCSVLPAPCSLLPAPCSVLHAPCSVLLCSVLLAPCSLLPAPAPCSVLRAPWLPAPCSVLLAPSSERLPAQGATVSRSVPCGSRPGRTRTQSLDSDGYFVNGHSSVVKQRRVQGLEPGGTA